MDMKNNGTSDPEISKIRLNMKQGILAYDKYMREQGKLVQQEMGDGNVVIDA